MYNLLYYQIVVQLCVSLTDLECDFIMDRYHSITKTSKDSNKPTSSRINKSPSKLNTSHLGQTMARVLSQTGRLSHLRRESIPSTSAAAAAKSSPLECTSEVNLKSMEMQLQKLCLPFLRIAALLRQHLYHHDMPEISTPPLEFVRLIYYLELVTESMDWECFNASKGLCFIPGTELTLPIFWFEQLMDIRPPSDTIRELVIINQHVAWQQPKLLSLPREYERLFTVYIFLLLN